MYYQLLQPKVYHSMQPQTQEQQLFKSYLGMKVWQLRHLEVSRFIAQHGIKRILDLGCSTGQLLQRLSRSSGIELLVGVDIDEQILNQAKNNVAPENIQKDIQFDRSHPQEVFLFQGDITKPCLTLKSFHCQLVTFIEVIEHLPLPAVPQAINNIFRFLRPKYVLLSTPNRDFNIFFNFKHDEMRHWDHKFQWTRSEFQLFCEEVHLKFSYNYQISGVGEHASDSSNGFCTQIAIFSRNEDILQQNMVLGEEIQKVSAISKLVVKNVNCCWKSNIKGEIMKAIYKFVSYDCQIDWKELFRMMEDERIIKCMKKENTPVDLGLIQEILSDEKTCFEWDEKAIWRTVVLESDSESLDD